MKRTMLLAIAAATLAGNVLAAPPLKGDPVKGKEIASGTCLACHAADGNSVVPDNPVLAGQNAHYLFTQLKNFKSQVRKDANMFAMTSVYSEQDLLNVATYYSQQTPKPAEALNKTIVPLGAKLYRTGNAASKLPACMSCHGPAGKGYPDQFPRLGSQHAPQVYKQLVNFKAGELRKNNMMQAIAAKMTDDEMKAVAEYISGLR